MAGLLDTLAEKVKALGSSWAAYTAVGSFVLYVLGYLSLRFHLTILGVGTDLAVLDERYLFTGAKFLVYVFSSLVNVLLLLPVILALAYLLYQLRRLVPAACRSCLAKWLQRSLQREEWLALAGVVLSILMIQRFMKLCFPFSNMLVSKSIPDPIWLALFMLDEGEMMTYFTGLVGGTAIPLFILLALRKAPALPAPILLTLPTAPAGRLQFLKGLLAFLIVVQFLFLPVNYGVLIVDKQLPRLSSLGGDKPLAKDQQAWLVWEGKEGVTYLIRNRDGTGRTLLTLPRSEVKKTEIIGYDGMMRLLFESLTMSGKEARHAH